MDGPRALSKTVLGLLPSTINPPIITLSPVSTRARVDMLTSFDGLAPPSISKASIKPIPVAPPTPLSIAVYAPGGKVMRIADSCVQPGGDVDCPGLARHGSKPVAEISLGAPHVKPIPAHMGSQVCQSLFCAIIVEPENICKNGSATVPGTKNGAPLIEGPRARIKTVFAAVPSTTNPPIITLLPVSTAPRVAILDKPPGATARAVFAWIRPNPLS